MLLIHDLKFSDREFDFNKYLDIREGRLNHENVIWGLRTEYERQSTGTGPSNSGFTSVAI